MGEVKNALGFLEYCESLAEKAGKWEEFAPIYGKYRKEYGIVESAKLALKELNLDIEEE